MNTHHPEHDSTLAAVPIFAGLSRRQRSRLHGGSRIVQHPAGARGLLTVLCARLREAEAH